jgi:hypothetical protein
MGRRFGCGSVGGVSFCSFLSLEKKVVILRGETYKIHTALYYYIFIAFVPGETQQVYHRRIAVQRRRMAAKDEFRNKKVQMNKRIKLTGYMFKMKIFIMLTLGCLNFSCREQSDVLKVAHLCDPQLGFGKDGFSADSARLEQAIRQVNALSPDVVVIAGDLVNDISDEQAVRTITELIAKIRPPVGVQFKLSRQISIFVCTLKTECYEQGRIFIGSVTVLRRV